MKRSTDKAKAAKASRHLREFCLYYHEPRTRAKSDAKVKEYQRKKDGTLGKKYLVKWCCAECEGLFEKVHMDHVKPVGKAPAWPYTIGELLNYLTKLLAPYENWQCLCPDCHAIKTKEEAEENARRRREAKEKNDAG